MEWTCCECEHKFDSRTGDIDERTCFNCLEKEEYMETTLLFQRVGDYSMNQCSPDIHCSICGTPKMGTVLVQTKDNWEECLGKMVRVIEHICIDCLLHEYESTRGLWCTDKPELIPKDKKHLFFQLTSEQEVSETK